MELAPTVVALVPEFAEAIGDKSATSLAARLISDAVEGWEKYDFPWGTPDWLEYGGRIISVIKSFVMRDPYK